MNVSRSRVVLDSNLIISAFLIPESIPSKALQIAIEYFDIIISVETALEVTEVLKRDKFNRYGTKEERAERVKLYVQTGVFFPLLVTVTDCKDPKDNKFLELALSSETELIVSGDKKDLLVMDGYRGLEIITARNFIENFSKYLL